MKVTLKELMEKVDNIKDVIDELDNLPEIEACTKALQYLDEYVDMLLDTKVDI